MAMNKVLLIGGAGFIGRHLAARLVHEGIRVRIATRRSERAKALTVLPGVEVVDIGTTAKTMPEFPDLWDAMLHGDGAA